MVSDSAYQALTEAGEDERWAFGTDFGDALADVDTALPDGVDRADLASYCLMLGDDTLVLSHRLQQWCTRLPELEEEVAVANIALDLLGQARLLLSRAATAAGGDADEDHYAFFRDARQFRNVRLVETENGDFAELIARMLVFSTWRLTLLDHLTGSADPVLAAVAAKGVKEVSYHRDWAARWTVRLGDGTAHSHERMRAGLDTVWSHVAELFTPHPVELRLARPTPGETAAVAVDPAGLRAEFDAVLGQVLRAATLPTPQTPPHTAGPAGRHGAHTSAMAALLAELHEVARAHPEATW